MRENIAKTRDKFRRDDVVLCKNIKCVSHRRRLAEALIGDNGFSKINRCLYDHIEIPLERSSENSISSEIIKRARVITFSGFGHTPFNETDFVFNDIAAAHAVVR